MNLLCVRLLIAPQFPQQKRSADCFRIKFVAFSLILSGFGVHVREILLATSYGNISRPTQRMKTDTYQLWNKLFPTPYTAAAGWGVLQR
jgi:hypothetical protein